MNFKEADREREAVDTAFAKEVGAVNALEGLIIRRSKVLVTHRETVP